jgi:uncharacterized protein (UPF0332 family)
MDPREFKSLASDLVSSTKPAYLRTAISRAYYAAYNVGAELLMGMGFEIHQGPSAHANVEYRFNNSGSAELSKASSQLALLRTRRIEADYRLDRKNVENPKTAEALVKEAEKIIKVLDKQCIGSQRENIIKAIREYDRVTSGRPTPK